MIHIKHTACMMRVYHICRYEKKGSEIVQITWAVKVTVCISMSRAPTTITSVSEFSILIKISQQPRRKFKSRT